MCSLNQSLKIRPKFNYLVLSGIVLALFYPTIFAEISLVDDIDTFNWLLNTEFGWLSIKSVVLPSIDHGGYYRPLIGLSFILDQLLFGASPVIMHFESVLFHLFNALMVSVITGQVLRIQGVKDTALAGMTAGLFFALHPVGTESVNWLSGRTDIMMANFVLVSCYFLLRHKLESRKSDLVLAIIAGFVACLAKEAAFGWVAGAAAIVMLHTGNGEEDTVQHSGRPFFPSIIEFLAWYAAGVMPALYFDTYYPALGAVSLYAVSMYYRQYACQRGSGFRLGKVAVIVASIILAALSAYMLRKIVFTSNVGKIGQTVSLISKDIDYSVSVFLGALGFYAKKFFLPLPLNFFILEIDPLYDLLGIAVILLLVNLFPFRSLASVFIFAGVFITLPALPFAFGTIAWTGYAERYIYLPSAFWIIAAALVSVRLRNYYGQKKTGTIAMVCACSAILLIFGYATYTRNKVWQSNVSLLADTADKNPRARVLREIYMAALIEKKRYPEAKVQYKAAQELYARSFDDRPDLLMAGMLQDEGDPAKALNYYERAVKGTKYTSERSLGAIVSFLKSYAGRSLLIGLSENSLNSALVQYESRLKSISTGYQFHYLEGQKSLAAGNRAEAILHLREALGRMPRDSYQYRHTENLLLRLQR